MQACWALIIRDQRNLWCYSFSLHHTEFGKGGLKNSPHPGDGKVLSRAPSPLHREASWVYINGLVNLEGSLKSIKPT